MRKYSAVNGVFDENLYQEQRLLSAHCIVIFDVKQENESLRVRVDELTKAALNSKTELSEDCMQEIIHAVKNAAESCFVNGQQHNASGSSECKKVGTEQ